MRKILFSLMLFFCFVQQIYAAHINNELTSDAYNKKVIFDDINAYRVQHGLSPLQLNDIISQTAKNHSRDMALNSIPFGHAGFESRMQQLFQHFRHSNGIAENVAYTNAKTTDVIQQWLHSSGHRENIEGNYSLTGIGIAHGAKGRVYVTQIFLRV